jgi:hypothetical protein
MLASNFQYCCGAQEIGSFYPGDTTKIEPLLTHSLCLCTLLGSQIKDHGKMLEGVGFREIGTFVNSNTHNTVHLFARGLNPLKGDTMPRGIVKKTKKTITLRTGKKIVKKVRATGTV